MMSFGRGDQSVMHMLQYVSPSVERRLQVLLDEDRYSRLLQIAQDRGVSVATVVLEAIDRGLPDLADRRRKAGRRLLNSDDMPAPDPEGLRDELNQLRG